MARVLAVDDDPLARAVVGDLLRAMGHEVVVVDGGAAAMDVLDAGPVDVVVADVLMPGIDGFDLAARALGRDPAPAVVLVSGAFPGNALAHARGRGLAVKAALVKPLDAAELQRVVGEALAERSAAARVQPPAESPEPTWSGAGFLERVRGPFERVPPLRLLFLAHRVAATGAVVIHRPEYSGTIVVRGGQVVHVEGLPGLLRSLRPVVPDTRHLVRDVGAAVAQGHAITTVLEAAVAGLGAFLSRAVRQRGGEVYFEADATTPPGAFPLPQPVPRILALGLAAGRPEAQVEADWGALQAASLTVRVPDDSPERRWGLDAVAMRVLRLAQSARTVGELFGPDGTAGGRRAEVLRALDLLYILGLLTIDGGPLERDEPEAGAARAPAPPTEEDPRTVRLRAALAAMEGAAAVEVLELGTRLKVTEDDVVNAYRDISKRFHPDTFFNAAPVVRSLAEACFSKVNSAYETLRMPGGVAEANRVLAARARGQAYVTEKEHIAARVAFKRGEVLYRNRDWRGADEMFAEALRLDPTGWPHGLYAARAGYLSRRLTADEALAALAGLDAGTPVRRAEVYVWAANILKLEGRAEEAQKRYRSALEADPENRDAQREVRLSSARAERERAAETTSTATSVISGLFRRASDKPKPGG